MSTNASSSRRRFLTGGAAALGLAAFSTARTAAAEPSSRRRTLRIAHLTDTHVTAQREGLQDPVAGFTAALRHAQSQADKPDLILFGGDLVMDSLKREKDAVLAQWALWKGVVSAEARTPWRVCLGNHDVWAWALRQTSAARDPLFGKRLALEQLGMSDRYYSFDQGGWHIVVLDSVQRDHVVPGGYTARLDEEQTEWLAADLAAVPAARPVIVFSHIPILASCVFMGNDLTRSGAFVLNGGSMHTDVKELKTLFHRHANVKACVSGHVHLVDEVRYLGVRYLCNGAVSGGWWKGPNQEFPAAYSLIDLHDDGTVESQIVPYGGPAHG